MPAELDAPRLPLCGPMPGSALLCQFDHLYRETETAADIGRYVVWLGKNVAHEGAGHEPSTLIGRRAGEVCRYKDRARKKKQTDGDNSAPNARTRH